MKTASRVLYIVGLVLTALSIVFTIIGGFRAYAISEIVYRYLVQNGVNPASAGFTVEIILYMVIASLVASGIAELVAVILVSIAIHRSFHDDPSYVPHVLGIIAGGLTGSGVLIAGGVLGLIANRRETRVVKVEPTSGD